jgi:hypothetical protein
LAFIGEDIGIGLVEEDHLLVRDVGMDRHLVGSKVVVDEEAVALVDHQILHQGRARAHGHGADHLAARRFRVEDAAGRADRQHAPDAHLAGRGIDGDLDKMPAEGRELSLLVEIADTRSRPRPPARLPWPHRPARWRGRRSGPVRQ